MDLSLLQALTTKHCILWHVTHLHQPVRASHPTYVQLLACNEMGRTQFREMESKPTDGSPHVFGQTSTRILAHKLLWSIPMVIRETLLVGHTSNFTSQRATLLLYLNRSKSEVPCNIFRNKLVLHGEELVPRPTPKLEDHLLLTVRDCLFNIFSATLHIWRLSPPSVTRGRCMPWWQGPT
jgi:hypothetical protein